MKKRKNTNSWIAAILTWVFAVGAFLLCGWTGLLIYGLTLIWASVGLAWNQLRADALRPRAEWADEPVPPKDWVL